MWLYSMKAVDYVESYMNEFSWLFERLNQSSISSELLLKNDLFPKDG